MTHETKSTSSMAITTAQSRTQALHAYLREQRFTAADVIAALSQRNNARDTVAIAIARERYANPSDDDIEIDDITITSVGSAGRFVMMWAWVSNNDIRRKR